MLAPISDEGEDADGSCKVESKLSYDFCATSSLRALLFFSLFSLDSLASREFFYGESIKWIRIAWSSALPKKTQSTDDIFFVRCK